VRAIVDGVRPLGVPVIYFVNASPHLVDAAATSGADVLGLAGARLDEAAARRPRACTQGNLDPHVLFADPATVRPRHGPLTDGGRAGHIRTSATESCLTHRSRALRRS
jgi:uroporphyrinogen-III decarboxylase